MIFRSFKKLAALMLAALTVLSIVPISAFAAEGDAVTITFHRACDADGNPMFYNGEAIINGYHAGGIGEPKFRMFVDGSTAFCLEPGVPLHTGDTLYESSSEVWNSLSAGQKKAVGLALLYGYQGNSDSFTGSDDEKWMATQTLLWEFVVGCRNATAPYEQTSNTAYQLHYGENYPNAGSRAVYDEIVALLTRHNTIPSFMSASPDSAATAMEYQNGQYVLTLADTNGVLSEYDFSCSDSSVSVSKSGNTLTLTATQAFSHTVRITASRNNIPVVSSGAKLIAYGSDTLQDVVTGVENADPVYCYLNVETRTGAVKLIKTSEDGVVSGIRFTISGEGIEQTVVTGSDGTILIDDLVPGTYTVTEQASDQYEPQNSQTVTVVSGQTATVTFNNVLKRGDLTVIKTSEDDFVEGMRFHLYGTSFSGIAVDEYAVTDSTGKAYFTGILPGSGYVLEEVDTPNRYVVPADQTTAIEWNAVTEQTFINILKKWNATVNKRDSETGTPQGNASLAGAVYGVYRGDELIDTYTTDANGSFTTDYYVCGDNWTIREISPSEGYLLDETIHPVGAEAEHFTIEYNPISMDVTERIVKGRIAIIKHCDNGETQIETPEEGASFAVYLKSAGSYDAANDSERDYLVCDENGFAETKELPYGIYTVEQTSGWDGCELMPPFDVYISEHGHIYRYIINNAAFESYLKVVKVDAETGNPIAYAGAGFKIYRPDGTLITQTFTYPEVTVIDTFYTNDEGYLITPEKLERGTGYALVEVSAPYGYVLDPTPVYFDVTEDDVSEDDPITVIVVTKEDMPQKGIIRIGKTGEMFSTVAEGKEIYRPVFAVCGLPGAVYEIRAAEDIVTQDGTIRYAFGELVDTVTTDANGEAESGLLYLGKYEVKEIEAPFGMVLNNEAHIVELVYAGQEISITETAAGFYNERQRVKVSIFKTLEQNEAFGIGMNGELSAVTFGLYAAETLTALDGSIIPTDGLLEIVTFDEIGHAECKTDLPFGSYYLKELSTDQHYIISDEKYPVVFEYAGQETAVVEIFANNGESIQNELLYGEIHGLKKDDNGTGLAGALIGLFRSDETEFSADTAIMTVISSEDGSFSFANLPYGAWIVREIAAPEGFILSETAYEVSVSEHGEVIEIEIENAPIRGKVQLVKVDQDFPDSKLAGAIFELYRDSNGNKELDADDEKLGELSEVSIGVYEQDALPYGGYFVKETKAPEGFVLDENAYYFEIKEHGETVIVENEAGVGFVNSPQRGGLKIFKTSSDKKVEGFSFRVTGPNGYEQVFTTDGNGEILIEGLRIGDYRVSEISDSVSAAYVLPADQIVTVTAGDIAKVVMHNELRDTPKTGDNRNSALWYALTGFSFMGMAVCGFLAARKKRKGDAE